VGYFILNLIFQSVLLPILSPEAFSLQTEMQAQLEAEIEGGAGLGAIVEISQEFAEPIAKASIMTVIVTLLLSNAVLGGIVAMLKSDPNDNKHGPAPSGANATFS
ncbi:MAG: hypothetical protein AAFQ67_08825, partial [Pseudomonadota bacterium]